MKFPLRSEVRYRNDPTMYYITAYNHDTRMYTIASSNVEWFAYENELELFHERGMPELLEELVKI